MAYTKTTWIDKAVQYAKRYYMNWDGGNDKNLLPPFTDWTLDSHAVATSAYALTLTATANWQASTVDVPVLPNTAYTFSVSQTGGGQIAIWTLDVNRAIISSVGYASAPLSKTTESNAVYIRVGVANPTSPSTFTFTNPQLELGSSATSFTPKKMCTITQSGGTVTAAGTPVNAANLNNLEQGVLNTIIMSVMGAI